MGWYEVGDISYILEPSGDKMEQQSLFLSKDLRREGEGDSKDKDLPPLLPYRRNHSILSSRMC